uniref:SMP-30/Gluconolactonase/LRE-like region domain-containing protein n=1 Tax=Leersia perrieri TaxID=77586 RepID=A0A0D9VT75_9ORYZ
MCGGCRRRRRGAPGASPGAGWGGGTTALTVATLAAAAVVAFLEGTARGVTYVSDGWFHDGVWWDAEGGRFLVTTMTDGRVVEVRGGGGAGAGAGEGKEEARVVVADPGAAGRTATGLALDAKRRRLLVAYTELAPWFGYAAVAAYELGSWRRLFLVRLDEPGDSTLADDVAVDDEGNAYVTDAKGNKIWKVSPDGEPLSVIKNATFSQRPGWINNFVGLNGIVYHPNGYLLVIHTSGGDLFKVDPKTGSVHVVRVQGSLKTGDGLALLSPTRLVAAGLVSRLVESNDDWKTATVTGRYVGPAHRIGSSATVKDGDVYINHIVGFGLGKKTHVISKAAFAPL